jgi:predicted porin
LTGDQGATVATATAFTDTETLIGVKVPVGAVTFGLDYAQRTRTGFQDVNGYSLGAQYNLSKRTNVQASYASWKQAGASAAPGVAAVDAQSGFRLYLSHSF